MPLTRDEDVAKCTRPRRSGMRRLLIGVVVALTAALAYELLWGKLFPYSPVVVGFARHELPRSIIYVQTGAQLGDLARLDGVLPAVERSHGMRFTGKPRLFVFRDSGSYRRRSPSRARFCAFYTGALLISPWAEREAREGKISLAVYVTHELSHILLFQHMSPLSAYRFPRWLLEGMATYTANQMGTAFYPGKAEMYRLMREGNYVPPQSFHTRAGDRVKLHVPNRWPFAYSEFACIVDYLIETGGRPRFMTYLSRLMAGGDRDAVFRQTYGIGFDAALLAFWDHVSRTK